MNGTITDAVNYDLPADMKFDDPLYEDQVQDFDAEVFGENLRHLRRRRGLTTRQLAELAGVARATLLRVEHGLETRLSVRNRLCAALQTRMAQLCIRADAQDYALHRDAESKWSLVRGEKAAPRNFSDEDLKANSERTRIAKLGWASRFTSLFESVLHNCEMQPGLMELYSKQESFTTHPGEEFVYCLEGAMELTIGDKTIRLESGDSIMFDANIPHKYGPIRQPADPPAKGLVVVKQGGRHD